MIKKAGIIFLLSFLFLMSWISFSLAANETASSISINQSKINDGIKCLANKVSGKCSTLGVEQISLVLLSDPNSSITTECKSSLLSKKSLDNCWPAEGCTIKDTAMAMYALKSLNENADNVKTWLLAQNKTSAEVIWFLQEDSGANICTVTTSTTTAAINVLENKRLELSSSEGNCFSISSSNLAIEINPECYGIDIGITCQSDFKASLYYQQKNSPTIYVVPNTQSKSALDSANFKIVSKCLGISDCDYEGTIWSALALSSYSDNSANLFIQYILALSDANERFFPEAFIYKIISGAESKKEYETRIIEKQTSENYWSADSSPYSTIYDTALGLMALKASSKPDVLLAKKRLLSPISQDSLGCWNDDITDTAMVLFALNGGVSSSPSSGSSNTPLCYGSGLSCLTQSQCSGEILDNFFCSNGGVCCKISVSQTCQQQSGRICNSSTRCSISEQTANDTTKCCLGACDSLNPGTKADTTTECSTKGGTCKNSCSSNEKVESFTCETSSQKCCIAPSSSSLWLWLLVIAILAILGAIGFIMRDKIRLFFFKRRANVKEEPMQQQRMPSQGYPSLRRNPIMPPRMPQKDKSMDDVFKKLKDMTKK